MTTRTDSNHTTAATGTATTRTKQVRGRVQPIYTINTIPAAIREYIIKAHGDTLQANRIVRAINGTLVSNNLRPITIFDLYMMWLQLFKLKAISCNRPMGSPAYMEFTIRQFAAYFKVWLDGNKRDVCHDAASAVRLVGANAADARAMRKFSDKMFSALTNRRREINDALNAKRTASVAKEAIEAAKDAAAKLTTNDSLTRAHAELPLPLDTTTPHVTAIQSITDLLSYATATSVNGIPSIVIPLENEVLESVRKLSIRGARVHGLISAIRLVFGEARKVQAAKVTEALEPPRSMPQKPSVEPVTQKPKQDLTPLNRTPDHPPDKDITAVHLYPDPQPTSFDDEPLFDSPEAYDEPIPEGIDIDERIDVAAVIRAAEQPDAEGTMPGNRNGTVNYSSIELEDKGVENTGVENTGVENTGVENTGVEDKGVPSRQPEINALTKAVEGKLAATEEKDPEAAKKGVKKMTAEDKRKQANDLMIEAQKAERSIPLRERLGKSSITD